MKVSMNGLRRNITSELTELSEMIELLSTDAKNDELHHPVNQLNYLAEQYNRLAQDVGVLNCVYDSDYDEDFTDQSEALTVRFLTEEE